jgi:hypothetical protein
MRRDISFEMIVRGSWNGSWNEGLQEEERRGIVGGLYFVGGDL